MSVISSELACARAKHQKNAATAEPAGEVGDQMGSVHVWYQTVPFKVCKQRFA
jgi:hypothetical protein